MKSKWRLNAPDPRLDIIHISSIFVFLPSLLSFCHFHCAYVGAHNGLWFSEALFIFFLFFFFSVLQIAKSLSIHLQIHWLFSSACSHLLLNLSRDCFILVIIFNSKIYPWYVFIVWSFSRYFLFNETLSSYLTLL